MFSTLGRKGGKFIFLSGVVFAKFRRGKNNFKKLYIYSQNSNPKFFQQGQSCDSLASLDLKS
jgi:hypothetical protein